MCVPASAEPTIRIRRLVTINIGEEAPAAPAGDQLSTEDMNPNTTSVKSLTLDHVAFSALKASRGQVLRPFLNVKIFKMRLQSTKH